MKLSISCRIAEGFLSKEEASMSIQELAELAVSAGYDGICMRASQIGVNSDQTAVDHARQLMDQRNLNVTMLTGDFDIVYNNDRGPDCLRNIEPYLELALALGAPMLRVCLKRPDDIAAAQLAADQAADRGLALVHQCHAASLFETVDGIVDCLEQIDRPNFGLVFEAGNLEECGQSYGVESMHRLAPWILNVYLQNQKLQPDGPITLETWCRGSVNLEIIQIPEAGGINFETVFSGLRDIGYNGTVTVHQAGPEDGVTRPVDTARETAEFLRQYWP